MNDFENKKDNTLCLKNREQLSIEGVTDVDAFNEQEISAKTDYGSLLIKGDGLHIDELDLSCDELWENGAEVKTPFDGLIAFSDATELWGLNESTLRKAITYGKLVNGVDVCKFGKQWIISMDAMKREYGEPKEKDNAG